jgi:hypothetical protein
MPSADTNGSNGVTSIPDAHIVGGHPKARPRLTKPLVYSGSLDRFTHRDLTPVIGREYEGLQVTELLEANNEQLIEDLACTGTLCNSNGSIYADRNSITTWSCLSPESRRHTATDERTLFTDN